MPSEHARRIAAIVLPLILLCTVASQASARGRVTFHFGGGMAAAGDLFSVEVPQTLAWEAPGGTFQARRWTVTMDENVALDVGVGVEATPDLQVRVTYRMAEMDATVLANDSQYVTPAPWDVMTLNALGVGLQWNLARGPWRPFLSAGIAYRAIDAGEATLDRDDLVPVFGAGLAYFMERTLGLRLEIRDTIQQVETAAYAATLEVEDLEFREYGPQHWFDIVLTMELGF